MGDARTQSYGASSGAGRWLKKRAALPPPVRNFNGSGAFKLIEVFLGPDRHVVPPLQWRAAPRLAEAPVVRTPQEAPPVAAQAEAPFVRTPQEAPPVAAQAEELGVRKPQQAVPAAELPREDRSDATGVSPRRRVAG